MEQESARSTLDVRAAIRRTDQAMKRSIKQPKDIPSTHHNGTQRRADIPSPKNANTSKEHYNHCLSHRMVVHFVTQTSPVYTLVSQTAATIKALCAIRLVSELDTRQLLVHREPAVC